MPNNAIDGKFRRTRPSIIWHTTTDLDNELRLFARRSNVKCQFRGRPLTNKLPVATSTLKPGCRSYSPIRARLRFASEEDRQYFRQGIRTLALLYAGMLVLLVAITTFHGEWREQNVTAKAAASAVDISRSY